MSGDSRPVARIGPIWMTSSALAAIRGCPDYPRALATYVDLLTIASHAPDGTFHPDANAMEMLVVAGVISRDGNDVTIGSEYERQRPLPTPAPKTCVYCEAPATHKDHVVARSKGGANRNNIVPACAPCNISKSNHDVREWVNRSGRDWSVIEARIVAHGVTTI